MDFKGFYDTLLFNVDQPMLKSYTGKSRYTIKDSVTDKFYKWNVTVADGVPSIELVEV